MAKINVPHASSRSKLVTSFAGVVPVAEPAAVPSIVALLHQEPAYVIACYKNVLFVMWRKTPKAHMIDTVSSFVERLVASHHSNKCAIFVSIGGGVGIPLRSFETRNQEMSEKFANNLYCTTVLIEGTSFAGRFIKTMFLTYVAQFALGFPVKAFHDKFEAVTWCAAQTPDVTEQELAAALANLRVLAERVPSTSRD